MNYSIMHVDNRALDNIKNIKSILNTLTYINDIKYVNANKITPWSVLDRYDINLESWSPYDGRTTEVLLGELGHLASTLNIFQYMIDKNIDQILIIEDDAILYDNFLVNLNKCINDLPDNFDFLSLFYNDGHNWIDEKTLINSEFIHRSYNQYSGTPAMIYTLSCAKKFIKLLKRKNIEYTTDCMLYKYASENLINGYSIIPNNLIFIKHNENTYKSIIDPINYREN